MKMHMWLLFLFSCFLAPYMSHAWAASSFFKMRFIWDPCKICPLCSADPGIICAPCLQIHMIILGDVNQFDLHQYFLFSSGMPAEMYIVQSMHFCMVWSIWMLDLLSYLTAASCVSKALKMLAYFTKNVVMLLIWLYRQASLQEIHSPIFQVSVPTWSQSTHWDSWHRKFRKHAEGKITTWQKWGEKISFKLTAVKVLDRVWTESFGE